MCRFGIRPTDLADDAIPGRIDGLSQYEREEGKTRRRSSLQSLASAKSWSSNPGVETLSPV